MIKCIGTINGDSCHTMGLISNCFNMWHTIQCSDCYFTKTVLESAIFTLLEKKKI